MSVVRRCGRGTAAALAAGVLLTACASVSNGHPLAAPAVPTVATSVPPVATSVPPVATSSPPTTSAPPTISEPPTSTASFAPPPVTSSGTAPATVLCSRSTDELTAHCLEGALSAFWSGQLNQAVDEPVALAPPAAQVPHACRTALQVAPAFTCRANRTLYVSAGFLAMIRGTFHGDDRTYALASVQAHEMGHVVQYAVRQPQIELRRPTDADSRFVEQQADCLSGVWAAQADGTDHFDASRFLSVATRLVALISTNPEIRTHGTPPERSAAIARGIEGGRPQSCRLATFH